MNSEFLSGSHNRYKILSIVSLCFEIFGNIEGRLIKLINERREKEKKRKKVLQFIHLKRDLRRNFNKPSKINFT